MHYHLGKIFISHTAADKPFVRLLADQITKNGFQVWLDERDLVVGDPLAENISKALTSARVVLVIVSSASVSSKWLRYELNLATERMVKGLCRVIPIVIDQTALPPEVRGLLYADCRDSLDNGWPSILTALQYESRQAALKQAFWSRAEVLIKEVFGPTGSASDYGEYKSRDCSLVYLPIQDADGNDEVVATYEVISSYLPEPIALNKKWFDEYCDELDNWPDSSLSLVVSERPIEFKLDASHPANSRIGVRRFREDFLGYTHRQVIVADLSGLKDETEQKMVLHLAREMLLQSAELEARELREVRARNSQAR